MRRVSQWYSISNPMGVRRRRLRATFKKMSEQAPEEKQHGASCVCDDCQTKLWADWDANAPKECPHGVVGYCNDCAVMADLAYDTAREDRMR